VYNHSSASENHVTRHDATGEWHMRKILEGDMLEQRARQLGVDIQGDAITHSSLGRHQRASDYELQKRVLEAERSIRESSLWKLALISAIASVASAMVALFAVLGSYCRH
jgi:hypothetical protein